jgi:signal transduction histidine kinase
MTHASPYARREPSVWISMLIYVTAIGFMGWLRLYIYTDEIVTLTYGLPMLICLAHPSRILLWTMAVSFALMSSFKAWFIMDDASLSQWGMQMVNIAVMGVAIHKFLNLNEGLRERNAFIEQQNQELVAREEEISRQNEELQAQTEELAEQNEEIQQQSEELRVQTEELQTANLESRQREKMLHTLLESLQDVSVEGHQPLHICRPLIELFNEQAVAAAVYEQRGDQFVLLSHSGAPELNGLDLPTAGSFASLVIKENRTAYVDDLSERPDLVLPQLRSRAFRSVLSCPLRVDGQVIGAVEVYSSKPQQWTQEQFRIIEWVSTQCSLIIQARRLQSELVKANSELDLIVKNRTKELQDVVNELEHFSYTITHDLRAPLRAMQGFAGLLGEGCGPVLDSENREYLERINTAAARMDRLITDSLSYSRSMRLELPLEAVDLGKLLKGIIDSYPVLQLPNAHVTLEENLPTVMGNEAGLTQCFSNLLGNAVKFVRRDRRPEVTIRAEQRGDRVRVWVEDNGIGIPEDMQSRVFIMFQRLDRSYEGTGIGLALVKKVSERMGGSAGVESTPDQGSRFWIELNTAPQEILP